MARSDRRQVPPLSTFLANQFQTNYLERVFRENIDGHAFSTGLRALRIAPAEEPTISARYSGAAPNTRHITVNHDDDGSYQYYVDGERVMPQSNPPFIYSDAFLRAERDAPQRPAGTNMELALRDTLSQFIGQPNTEAVRLQVEAAVREYAQRIDMEGTPVVNLLPNGNIDVHLVPRSAPRISERSRLQRQEFQFREQMGSMLLTLFPLHIDASMDGSQIMLVAGSDQHTARVQRSVSLIHAHADVVTRITHEIETMADDVRNMIMELGISALRERAEEHALPSAASGRSLDTFGASMGFIRNFEEPDAAYRQRLRDAIASNAMSATATRELVIPTNDNTELILDAQTAVTVGIAGARREVPQPTRRRSGRRRLVVTNDTPLDQIVVTLQAGSDVQIDSTPTAEDDIPF